MLFRSRASTCAVDDRDFVSGETLGGAAHMVGNVWEWCADWYGPFAMGGTGCWQGLPASNPLCSVIIGDIRALRGGGWTNQQTRHLRAASRAAQLPEMPDPALGFRCVRRR